jgi:hypothetical protein
MDEEDTSDGGVPVSWPQDTEEVPKPRKLNFALVSCDADNDDGYDGDIDDYTPRKHGGVPLVANKRSAS